MIFHDLLFAAKSIVALFHFIAAPRRRPPNGACSPGGAQRNPGGTALLGVISFILLCEGVSFVVGAGFVNPRNVHHEVLECGGVGFFENIGVGEHTAKGKRALEAIPIHTSSRQISRPQSSGRHIILAKSFEIFGRQGSFPTVRPNQNILGRGLPVVANAERHLVGVASHIGDSNVSPKLPIGSIRSDSNKVFALPNLRRSSVSCDSEQVAGVVQSAYGDTQGSEGNPQRTEHTEGGNDIFPFCKEWLICGGILLICLGAFIGHLDRRYDRRTEDYANWILNYEGVNGEYANPGDRLLRYNRVCFKHMDSSTLPLAGAICMFVFGVIFLCVGIGY